MTPGSLVQVVNDQDWDGMWVGLPNGEDEWLKAPFLSAVYLGPTTSQLTLGQPPWHVQKNSEILYGGRVIIVRSEAIKEMVS